MSVAPFSTSVTIASFSACSSNGINYPAGPYLYYAQGVTGSQCDQVISNVGITFNMPTGFSNDSGGSFFLVQLVSNDTITGRSGSSGASLDTFYPYGGPPSNDNPDMYIPPSATAVTRDFVANMFLMWQSNATGSIPVPLGYQTWGFSGGATCSTNCGTASNWSATTNGTPGPIGGFQPSLPTQTQIPGTNNVLVYGYPTWTSLSQ